MDRAQESLRAATSAEVTVKVAGALWLRLRDARDAELARVGRGAATWCRFNLKLSTYVFQGRDPPFETAPRDERSSKNEPHRVGH